MKQLIVAGIIALGVCQSASAQQGYPWFGGDLTSYINFADIVDEAEVSINFPDKLRIYDGERGISISTDPSLEAFCSAAPNYETMPMNPRAREFYAAYEAKNPGKDPKSDIEYSHSFGPYYEKVWTCNDIKREAESRILWVNRWKIERAAVQKLEAQVRALKAKCGTKCR